MIDNEDAAGPSNTATRDPADDIALVLHASSTGDCVRSAIEASVNYCEVCTDHESGETRMCCDRTGSGELERLPMQSRCSFKISRIAHQRPLGRFFSVFGYNLVTVG